MVRLIRPYRYGEELLADVILSCTVEIIGEQIRIKFNIAECRTLTALRDALLTKLASGELRVNDDGHFIRKTKS